MHNILLPDVRIDVRQGSDFLFEITKVEITRVDCMYALNSFVIVCLLAVFQL